jgi:hypothetical protein
VLLLVSSLLVTLPDGYMLKVSPHGLNISLMLESKEKPVLAFFFVCVDNTVHVKNLDVIDLTRKHSTSILYLPPHNTHRMQTLDVSFMKPLRVYFYYQVQSWLRQNQTVTVTRHQIGGQFGAAYSRTVSIETALNCFKKTGIHPVNRSILVDHVFVAALSLLLVWSQMNEDADESGFPTSNGKKISEAPMYLCII